MGPFDSAGRIPATHAFRLYVPWMALLILLGVVPPAAAAPFDCERNHCGLLTRDNNPDLVIGTVEAVATPAQMRAVLDWAHAHGYWKSLPGNGRRYLNFIRLVSLRVPHSPESRSATVLMTREEFDSGPLKPGAVVRYSPHDAAHDAITYEDPSKQAYWALVGCVAQLCAAGDKDCIHRYRPGRFSRRTGVELNLASGRPLQNGAIIDPQTMLPRMSASKRVQE